MTEESDKDNIPKLDKEEALLFQKCLITSKDKEIAQLKKRIKELESFNKEEWSTMTKNLIKKNKNLTEQNAKLYLEIRKLRK